MTGQDRTQWQEVNLFTEDKNTKHSRPHQGSNKALQRSLLENSAR